MHGFYLDEDTKTIRFDVVLNFEISQSEALKIIRSELSEKYRAYNFAILPDVDISTT